MIDEKYREWNRTHDEIRTHGAMGNLNRGIEITTHGINTRLIAWPGNGFQTESVHVLTLKPGDASDCYTYDMAEEALLCLWGTGEIYVRGQWVTVAPGDMAFIPAAVPRGLRNPAGNTEDFVLVNQITPPQFDLYEEGGYYNREHGKMNFEVIEEAKKNTRWANLQEATEVHARDSSRSTTLESHRRRDTSGRRAVQRLQGRDVWLILAPRCSSSFGPVTACAVPDCTWGAPRPESARRPTRTPPLMNASSTGVGEAKRIVRRVDGRGRVRRPARALWRAPLGRWPA